MAAAADRAALSLSMMILSYRNDSLGADHKIALLEDLVLGNRVNFLVFSGWTDWHGAWTWDHRTSQLSVNVHHAPAQTRLRSVTVRRVEHGNFGLQFQGVDYARRRITMTPETAYVMQSAGEPWQEVPLTGLAAL